MLKVNWLPEARCSSLDEVAQRSRCTFRMRRDAASRAASKLEEVMRSCCERCAESASRPDIMSRLVPLWLDEGAVGLVSRSCRRRPTDAARQPRKRPGKAFSVDVAVPSL